MNAVDEDDGEEGDNDVPNISLSCWMIDIPTDAKYCASDLQPALTIAMADPDPADPNES
jgi:hypothetical protein